MSGLIKEEYKPFFAAFTCNVCGESVEAILPSRHRNGRSHDKEWTELDSVEEKEFSDIISKWKNEHENTDSSCWQKMFNPELSVLVFTHGELSNEVTMCLYEHNGYRFGKIEFNYETRYFLLTPKNEVKEYQNKFYQFIFEPVGSYIVEDYYSEISGDFNITYRSRNHGILKHSDGTVIYYTEYGEFDGNNSNNFSKIRFNSTTGEFE